MILQTFHDRVYIFFQKHALQHFKWHIIEYLKIFRKEKVVIGVH